MSLSALSSSLHTAAAAVELIVMNKLGLHVRPAAQIAVTASRFRAAIQAEVAGASADAKNALDLMLLPADRGARVRFTAIGDDAPAALAAITGLFEGKFGET